MPKMVTGTCRKAELLHNMFHGDASITIGEIAPACTYVGAEYACRIAELALRNNFPVAVSHRNLCRLEEEDPVAFAAAYMDGNHGSSGCTAPNDNI